MTELRQRHNNTNNTTKKMDDETDEFLYSSGAGLSAKALLDSSPQHHGVVLKLHVPILYSILPDFLKRIILSLSFLRWLAPSWKQRYLILCGSYLYKFNHQASKVPKGSPFAVETIETDTVLPSSGTSSGSYELSEVSLGSLPPGYTSVFSVSTLRRHHYYAVSDPEEAMLWIRSLVEARQETITRNMGHSRQVPYPQSWKYFDQLAQTFLKSKERIQERMEHSRMRELEMMPYADGGSNGNFSRVLS